MKKLFLLLILLPVYFQGCVILEETVRHIKTPVAWGGNFGSSVEGKDANVTFVHTSAVDSAHVVFGYPDTANWYDSVFAYPVAWGSGKIVNGAGLDLDSIGVHVVKVRYYSGGAVAGHDVGVWLHRRDAAVAGDAMTLTPTERVHVADTTWDRILTGATHNVPSSAGRRLRQVEAAIYLADGTAQWANSDSSIVLAAATDEADDYFNDNVIIIIEGTGKGQARTVHDYTGATDSVSLDTSDPWHTKPDETSVYLIMVRWPYHVAHIHDPGVGQLARGILGYADTAWVAGSPGDKLNSIDSVLVLAENLAHFWAACDSCYERHFPEDGTANKDSSYLINPGLAGSDTLVAKVVFKHSNVADVADSSYYYLNPWW